LFELSSVPDRPTGRGMADEVALDEAEAAPAAAEPLAVDAQPQESTNPAVAGLSGAGRKILALWLPTPSRRRLIDIDVEIVEDVDDGPDLILVSTRGPAARRASIEGLAETAPVVVVCHLGDEEIAAECVAHGAVTVVAEGAEATALRVIDGEPSSHLVDVFAGEVDRNWSGGTSMSVDPVTGLRTSSAFEMTLAELGKDGLMPRLGLVKLSLDESTRVIGPAATSVLKRRLAVAVCEAATFRGAEVFDLGDRLAFLAQTMTIEGAFSFGGELVALGALFAPNGDPLDVAVGSAGPESASDIAALRVLADRALEVAATNPDRVVDAEALSQHSAASVELGAAFAVAQAVDTRLGRSGHSVRIGDYSTEIARFLQLEPFDIAAVGLAGRLHDVGMLTLGSTAFDSSSAGYEAAQAAHPERGERYVRSSCGPVVAEMIRSHHETWDGSGSPDRLAGADIPVGARILAVAHVYDELVSAGKVGAQVEQELRAASGIRLDPDLVEAAIALFGRG